MQNVVMYIRRFFVVAAVCDLLRHDKQCHTVSLSLSFLLSLFFFSLFPLISRSVKEHQ